MEAAILAIFLLPQAVPPAADEAARKAEKARQALGWLEDADPELRALGGEALRRMGMEAVPFLEARLAEKGASELARVLREILEASTAEDSRAVRLEDLDPPEDLMRQYSPPDRAAVERYVRARYAEAYRLVQKKQYQRAYDLAGALLVLEPRSASSEAVRKLRRYCDAMILQTSLLEAKIVQDRPAYAAGERIDLRMRIRNIHSRAVRILYNPGPVDRPSGGRAVVQIEVRIPQERGDVTTLTASDMLDLEPEIPIATGAQWERGFVLDTSAGREYADRLQIYVVNVWTIPDRIESEGVPMTRRIQFEPAVVKVVPAKYAGYLEDPAGSFFRAVESRTSTPQDVFVAALLLEGEAKEKGIARLVELMKSSERTMGRVWIGHLLGFMTDQKFGDDWRRWEEWLRNRPGRPAGERAGAR